MFLFFGSVVCVMFLGGRGVVLFLEGVVWRCSWRCGVVFFFKVCLFLFRGVVCVFCLGAWCVCFGEWCAWCVT